MTNIHDWKDISEKYQHSILLGNGASIAIDGCFSYKSLLKTSKDIKLISKNIDMIFKYLETEDFEYVLSLLWHTYHINTALEIKESVSYRTYQELRNALIGTVRHNHANFGIIKPFITPIYNFLKRFSKIVSLNYDLIIYWSILEGNNELGNWFKDCFVSGSFADNWSDFSKPYNAKGASILFYPHGNLVLSTDIYGNETKINVTDGISLLDRILKEWESGTTIPLFVSEGSSEQKLRAIKRSHYLSTLYDSVLPTVGPTLVVYGWSMAEMDFHILKQLAKARLTDIAVSVYRDRPKVEIYKDISRMEQQLNRAGIKADIDFFDSCSENCWIKTIVS